MTTTTDALRLEEAVPLGYAVMARVAADAGVRVLGIKGPVLTAQGLRPARQSVDVDVLVEPAGFDRFRAALEAVGWHDAKLADGPGIIPIHSRTHRHPAWPCEVDVHHRFPGFLADPADVFEVLWARRTGVELAHLPVPAPDVVAHAGLAGLHYLRDHTSSWGRDNADRLARLIETTWTHAQVADLARVAAETGAGDTLRPLLDRLGAPQVTSRPTTPVALADWQLRVAVGRQPVRPWVVALRRLPWHRRPGFVVRGLWMSDEHFRLDDPTLGPTRRAAMRARGRRLARGVRALPGAVRDTRTGGGRG